MPQDGEAQGGEAEMTDEPTITIHVVLAGDGAKGQISVELESFLRFNRRMDRRLERLERRWAGWTTPRSARTDLRLRRR
jgi:hypothetical protein